MAPTAGPPNPKNGGERKRKAGGNGKKGKIFVEDKKDLLSLMTSITSSKDSIAESKVSKRKAIIDESSTMPEDKNKKSKKSIEREKELERAKATLIEKQRLKKLKKSSSTTPITDSKISNEPKKKRVGFA